ncbi:hemerythrin domain-containing protein [Pseudohoeflea coraliihabitans]|uniref:Hemerythrin domain-containing protein n=1 Tax=Pseudohoeflea coraliihabitans TaxID=2860393 RepID=A0ABS6WPJ7_9HYPH|nr:hemerythrin domain-containing protein [Pseudohoeflea sp. DP4N28-3]MBW3097899.1 hemerythrin domain-containing protein [Pseudohoeflea sp. DP4N28-3]
MTTTIYEAIKSDHEDHRDLLEKLNATEGGSDERRELWQQFYYDVKSHAAAEEETFYAKLMEQPDGQDDARHSVSEHKEMDDIMEELNGMDPSSSGWLTRFRTLKEQYEHHMEEEEQDIFPKAKEVVDEDRDGAHAKAFRERKAAERDLVDQKAEDSLEE